MKEVNEILVFIKKFTKIKHMSLKGLSQAFIIVVSVIFIYGVAEIIHLREVEKQQQLKEAREQQELVELWNSIPDYPEDKEVRPVIVEIPELTPIQAYITPSEDFETDKFLQSIFKRSNDLYMYCVNDMNGVYYNGKCCINNCEGLPSSN